MQPGDIPADEAIAAAMLRLASKRAPRTVCPSEVARALAADSRWRALMPRVRATAGRLVAEGRIVATQRGAVVDPVAARGPIRLRAAGDGNPPTGR
jgi:hypothetical protein